MDTYTWFILKLKIDNMGGKGVNLKKTRNHMDMFVHVSVSMEVLKMA